VGEEWTRRTFIRRAGAGALGVLASPAMVTAARADSQGMPVTRSSFSGPLLGAFAEPTRPKESYFTAITEFEDSIGRGIALYRSYRSWGQPIFNHTIDNLLNPDKNPYPVPVLYLTFHAFYGSKGQDCIAWSDIVAGVHDAQIDSWAQELAQLGGRPTYIAFHHEPENQLGTPPTGCGTPADFQSAYWYVRRRIEVVGGVSGLTWVITYMRDTFAPTLKHGGPEVWWPATSPYPDVPNDHLPGVDVYNRNMCHDRGWRTFHDLVDPTLQPRKQPRTPYRFSLGVGRRLFIGECGCVEGDACFGTLPHGTAKAQWFQDALAEMEGWTNLEAFSYSNVTGYGDGDYRIGTSPESLASFQAVAGSAYFSQAPP